MKNKSSLILILLTLFYACSINNRTSQSDNDNPLKTDYIVTGKGDTTTMVKVYEDSTLIHSYLKINGKKTLASISHIKENHGGLNGITRIFYPNQKLWAIVEYKNDKIWNIQKVYGPERNLLNPGSINNGNGTLIGYYTNGNIKYKGQVKNGYKVGEYIYFDSVTGDTIKIRNYDRGPDLSDIGIFDNIYVDPQE